MTTFADLGIQEALCPVLEQQGIKEPTGIQREMIGRVLSGRNLIAQAPTGTGKTLAYLLPALQRIDAAKRQTQVLILAPTYELAMQIAGVARTLSREAGLGVGVLGLIGGASLARQADKLKEKPQLVTGSAGRILELARQGKLKLRDTALLVLDEFDRMLDDQNLQDTAAVVRLLPKDRQVVMVSATVSKKALERADFLGSPERITVGEDEAAQKKRSHYVVRVPFREKAGMVRRLSRRLNVQRGLVFLNRSFDAERTLARLQFDGIRAGSLLGHQNKQERQKAIADFRAGRIRLLLATDLAARGLDIGGIDYVFNLDLPDQAQTYRHRAGRTARAGAAGAVITLADDKEMAKVGQLEQKLGIRFRPLPGGETRPGKKKSAGRRRRDSSAGRKPHA